VWISPRGEGPTGRGNLFPLPCLSRSRHLAPCQPYPARPSAGRETRTLLRHPPPRPRLRQGILIHFYWHPHPTRACGAPPPPPLGGGVRAWRYLVGSRIRGGAGEQPYPALLRDLPVHWTVGISPWGEGPTGRGNLFPLPCLSRSRHLASRCRHFCEGYPYTSAGLPHLARASLPAYRPPNRTCAPRAASMCRRCCSLPLFHREQRHIRRLAGPREGEQILARQPGDHEPVALNPV